MNNGWERSCDIANIRAFSDVHHDAHEGQISALLGLIFLVSEIF